MESDWIGEGRLIHAFADALAEIPGLHPSLQTGGDLALFRPPVDGLVDFELNDTRVRLVIEAKKSVFPRDVREAVWRLRDQVRHAGADTVQTVPVIIAEALSPGARSLLRQELIGYFDTGGSLFIPARGAFVYIDKPAPKTKRGDGGSLFKGRRALVLHALWESKDDWVGVHQLAKLVGVSPATVSETLQALEKHDWLATQGAGPTKERRLVDATGLLDAWTAHQKLAKAPELRRYFVPAPNLEALIPKMDWAFQREHVNYVVTGEAAAQFYSPYLSNISQLRCRVLQGPRVEAALSTLDARPVDEGWNLGLLETRSEGDFAFRRRGERSWIASPLQTYLDLIPAGGRSSEIAWHLRVERLSSR